MTATSSRLLLILLLALPASAQAVSKKEQKLREKLAKVWVEYGEWAQSKSLKAEGIDAVARAKWAWPICPEVPSLRSAVRSISGEKAQDQAAMKRRTKANKDAAKVCDKLAKLGPTEPRYDEFLFEAVALDPNKSRVGKISKGIQKYGANTKTLPIACRWAMSLRAADTEGAKKGKYDSLDRAMAGRDVALVRGEHPMVGYVSLPKNWSSTRKYKILVAVDGAGSNFLGAARGFRKTQGDRPFIVLAPCSLSNTNQLEPKKYPWYSKKQLEEHGGARIQFDLAGLASLLDVVRERFGGDGKIGITGFSGGGNLCYGWTATHPDTVLFSAPACANFSGQGFQELKPVEDGGPPIRIMTGALDPHRQFTHGKQDSPGIESQTDQATTALKELKFTNVNRTMLEGVKHSPMRAKVWDVADEFGR